MQLSRNYNCERFGTVYYYMRNKHTFVNVYLCLKCYTTFVIQFRSGTQKPGKPGHFNIICPGPGIVWNLSQNLDKTRKLAENLNPYHKDRKDHWFIILSPHMKLYRFVVCVYVHICWLKIHDSIFRATLIYLARSLQVQN